MAIPFFQKHLDADSGHFDPGEVQENAVRVMLDELLKWTRALKPMRTTRSEPTPVN